MLGVERLSSSATPTQKMDCMNQNEGSAIFKLVSELRCVLGICSRPVLIKKAAGFQTPDRPISCP